MFQRFGVPQSFYVAFFGVVSVVAAFVIVVATQERLEERTFIEPRKRRWQVCVPGVLHLFARRTPCIRSYQTHYYAFYG